MLLSEAGLAAALEAAAGAGPVPVECIVDDMARPAPEIEAALYFCCLEALQNAAKHCACLAGRGPGQPPATRASNWSSPTTGTGSGPQSVSSGSGLANLRDRAESVGGSVRVELTAGQGHHGGGPGASGGRDPDGPAGRGGRLMHASRRAWVLCGFTCLCIAAYAVLYLTSDLTLLTVAGVTEDGFPFIPLAVVLGGGRSAP